MLKDDLKKQFDNMLPYMKDEFKSLVNSILLQAEKFDDDKSVDVVRLQNILAQAKKLLSTDKSMKKLFSQLPRK